MKTHKITLELSEAQYRLFNPAARSVGTDVGSLLLAFACSAMQTNPVIDTAHDEVCAQLWRFVKCRQLPSINEGWAEGGIDFNQAKPDELYELATA